MDGRCAKHQFEASENICRECGNEFCADCLVYSFGPGKPPFCIACALAAAGVRTTAGNRPTKPKREIKKDTRARRKAEKKSRKLTGKGVEIDWAISSDPTEGLTEDDLLLPTASVDAVSASPRPQPPPTSASPAEPSVVAAAPSDATSGLGERYHAGQPMTPVVPTSSEPPQHLLRQAEIPVPPMPGMEPPPPPPTPSPTLPSPALDLPDPAPTPGTSETIPSETMRSVDLAHHIGPEDLFAPSSPLDDEVVRSSFGLEDQPWDARPAAVAPTPPPNSPVGAPPVLPSRPAWPDIADGPAMPIGARHTWPDEPGVDSPHEWEPNRMFDPLTPEELGQEPPLVDEAPPNWPNA